MPQEGGSGIFIQSHQKILEQISSWQIFFWNKTFLGPTFFLFFVFFTKFCAPNFLTNITLNNTFFRLIFFSNLNFHRPIFSIFWTTFFWDQNFLAQKCFGPKRFGTKFHCRIVLTSLFQEKFSVEIFLWHFFSNQIFSTVFCFGQIFVEFFLPKFVLVQKHIQLNLLWIQIFWGQKIFDQNNLSHKFIWTANSFHQSNFCSD